MTKCKQLHTGWLGRHLKQWPISQVPLLLHLTRVSQQSPRGTAAAPRKPCPPPGASILPSPASTAGLAPTRGVGTQVLHILQNHGTRCKARGESKAAILQFFKANSSHVPVSWQRLPSSGWNALVPHKLPWASSACRKRCGCRRGPLLF